MKAAIVLHAVPADSAPSSEISCQNSERNSDRSGCRKKHVANGLGFQIGIYVSRRKKKACDSSEKFVVVVTILGEPCCLLRLLAEAKQQWGAAPVVLGQFMIGSGTSKIVPNEKETSTVLYFLVWVRLLIALASFKVSPSAKPPLLPRGTRTNKRRN